MQQNLRYLIAFLIFLIFFQMGVIERVISQLGLTQPEIAIGMGVAMIASLVALQLGTMEFTPDNREQPSREVPIGFNFGGTLIPLFFILYFSRHTSFEFFPMALLILAVTAVVYPLTRIERKVGAVVYLFGAVVVAAVGGLALGGEHYLVWAYTCAVLGTLIGGDLLHLPQLKQLVARSKGPILIGAGGVMDAIFLSGLLAMMTAEAFVLTGLWQT